MKVCKCCGHPLPDDDISAHFPPGERILFRALRAAGTAGLSGWQLHERIGTHGSMSVVYVYLSRIRKKLPDTLEIVTDPVSGVHSTYYLREKKNADHIQLQQETARATEAALAITEAVASVRNTHPGGETAPSKARPAKRP